MNGLRDTAARVGWYAERRRALDVLIRLLRYVWVERRFALAGVVCALVGVGANVAGPQVMRVIVDRVFVAGRLELLPRLGALLLALAIVRGLGLFLQIYCAESVAQRVNFQLRQEVFAHLQRLSREFYDRVHSGQLVSRLTADIDAMRRFLGFGLIQLVVGTVFLVSALALCLTIHVRLTFVSLVTMPLILWSAYRFGRRYRPAMLKVREQTAQLTGYVSERMLGIRVVKGFGREDRAHEGFMRQADGLHDRNLGVVDLWSYFGPLMDAIWALGAAALLWYGGSQVIAGALTLGEFTAFEMYFLMMAWPVMALGFVISMMQEAAVAGGRVFELLDRQPTIVSPQRPRTPQQREGRFCFDEVTFCYPGAPPALEGVSLAAEPGETVAVVGPTGSGKSTLLSLLPRTYDVTAGAVLVDGIDVRQWDLRELRRQIAIVHQETFLFSATLRDNIAYGRPDASEDDIWEAAEMAQVAEFARELEEGLDTQVGERGMTLSGGQKQRVAIARAILKRPRILLLDDCTSNVDVETEHLVQQALHRVMSQCTTLVVAQRLSTLRRADRLVVLEAGRVTATGTHDELTRRDGLYRQLVAIHRDSQLRSGVAA